MPGRRIGAYVAHSRQKKRGREPVEPILGNGAVLDGLVDSVERHRPNVLPKVADAYKHWTPGERIFRNR